jgi:hypothetical protein
MTKSNYVGLTSGEWTCVYYGIAYLQPAYRKKRDGCGKRVRSTSAGHQQYYYIFERPTSDGIALKQIRASAYEALQIKRGRMTAEALADKKKNLGFERYVDRTNYCFCD